MNKGFGLKLLSLAVLLLLLLALSLLAGSISVPPSAVVESLIGQQNEFTDIIMKFRMPKALTCLLAGSSLAVSGLLMQTLFRNPLAGPDVLGISAGASLMVAIVIMAGRMSSMFFFSNPWIIALAASGGATLVFLLVLLISRFVRDNTSLLIVGLMIGATTASLVGVLQFISRAEDLQAFMIWGLGNVGGTGWEEILVLFVVTVLGLGLSIPMMKSLNGLLLGEQYASSIGIRVLRSRLLILTATCAMTGAVTAFCGPITFVGLAVPHLVRMLLPTTNHKVMIPAVAMGGAALLTLCDLLAQLPGSTQVLPLNAVTSILGAPVVIWLIIRQKRITV